MTTTPAQRPGSDIVRKARSVGSHEWRNFWRTQPIKDDVVLYESFSGNGVLCNPEAIFRRLLDAPEFRHLKHVWVTSVDGGCPAAEAEFANHPRVQFVRYRSPRYFRVLSTAKYLFNNATFPYEFGKRPGQVYVNTWHGTPLKTMGYDEPGGGPGARNVLRNFLAADYLLAANPFMADQMYESAFRLTNVYPGRIITEGSPRVDRQFLDDEGRRRVRARLVDSGITLDEDQKAILYAPTWRGESFHSPTNDVLTLAGRVRALRDRLPSDHQVLLRVHQQVYAFALGHPDLRDILVPNEIPSNEVLGVTDVLVNDYSSIFFDFLATGRPIVFFAPDMSSYEGYRGLYLTSGELPGPVVTRVGRLAEVIRAIGTGGPNDPAVTHADAYEHARKRFASKEDGGATERVIDVVFRGRTRDRDVRRVRNDGRPTVLIYLGGMNSNGITTSALNLLDNIDHDRFDVSVLYVYRTTDDHLKNEAAINPRVRVIPRVGGMPPSRRHARDRARLLQVGMDAPGLDVDRISELFGAEWRRCFGDAEFDHIIDFSGYAAFWSFLLLQGPARKRSIWLHNDLKADQMREIDGVRPHEANLGAVFSTYAGYDHLVSVSEALMEINRTGLSDRSPASRHTFSQNTINGHRILRMAHGVEPDSEPRTDLEGVSCPVGDLQAALKELSGIHGLPAIEAEVTRRHAIESVGPAATGMRTFVTVGRLSPEKNHARLVRAFDILHQSHPDTRLVIIGTGPLEDQVRGLATQLGLGEAIILTGQQDNPYAIMAEADAFVMSSDYEGQPMVILEARVLGLPVVSTNFASAGGALPHGVGLIVDQTPEALAEGMEVALAGGVAAPPFDADAYNAEAMEQFYRATGLDKAGRSDPPRHGSGLGSTPSRV